MSSQPAAPASLEGQLRAQGKQWVKTEDEITVGAFVQDILEGRLDQPEGRGAVGKVVFLNKGDNGQLDAMVDFERNYSVGIHLSELSRVDVLPRDPAFGSASGSKQPSGGRDPGAATPAGTGGAAVLKSIAVPPPWLSDLELANGTVRFRVNDGMPASWLVIEFSTNLTDWSPVFTNSTPTNVLFYTDPEADKSPMRFYRACRLPE